VQREEDELVHSEATKGDGDGRTEAPGGKKVKDYGGTPFSGRDEWQADAIRDDYLNWETKKPVAEKGGKRLGGGGEIANRCSIPGRSPINYHRAKKKKRVWREGRINKKVCPGGTLRSRSRRSNARRGEAKISNREGE